MTTMQTPTLALFVTAGLLAGCGTKFIAELEPEQLASSEGGSGSSSGSDDDPGQTVTSAGVETSGTSEGGTAIECEPDAEATCGPAPREDLVAFLPPPAPIGTGTLPEQTSYDCTVTELDFQPGASRVILDCGLELPVDASVAIAEVTFDKLAIDQAVHVAWTTSTDGNTQSFALSVDGQTLVLMSSGTAIDLILGTDVFAPFGVTAVADVCLAPCEVWEDRCYGYAREQLAFTLDGDPLATVWSQDELDVSVDGVDWRITAMAQDAVVVNPTSTWCDLPGYDNYAFRIADVTP